MTTFLRTISLSALLVLFVGVSISLAVEDLIPPTRSLEGQVETPGRLTVVSEPPDLKVFLDDLEIGQTPIWLKEVEPGFYTLRVQDSEKDVFVESGKTVTLSFFKGSFIDVPREPEALSQPRPPRKSAESSRPTTPETGEETRNPVFPFDWWLIFRPKN